MITPIPFKTEDFLSEEELPRFYHALQAENMQGSELVDNMILLRFVDRYIVQEVLQRKYNIHFAWLNMDPTPEDLREIADRHKVMIDRSRGLVVYVPLGVELDDATLSIDIPQYEIKYRFIADVNYRMLRAGMPPLNFNEEVVLSRELASFRPLLLFRRLILDCIERLGTNMQFESVYIDKKPAHRVLYRIKRELQRSKIQLDFPLLQEVLQAVVSKLAPSSVSDLDSLEGITTQVRDLFEDGTCDLRITGSRISAGYYVDFAIQTTITTDKRVHELGFPVADVETIRDMAHRRTGLTLVTGEQRAGKNTTIFAMLNEIVEQPIRIFEYSNPIENHMPFPQLDYRGDMEVLKAALKRAKKQDIDIAVLNEIPDADVAFAVRDLVNSAIGVITTTHVNRAWHLPLKLQEFFGKDYKTIVSQLNVCINHKMFRRWKCAGLQKRPLVREHGSFEAFCYKYGVRQYFTPPENARIVYELQPLTEIIVFDDALKLAMLNFEEVAKAEQMLESHLDQKHARLENKVAAYINEGLMSIDEMKFLL